MKLLADKDFGELVFRLRRATVGVLLVRLAGMPSESRAEAVTQAIEEHGDQMAGAFTVLSPWLVRIRPPLYPRLAEARGRSTAGESAVGEDNV